MTNTYRFTSIVWVYKSNNPWHFATINQEISKEIKNNLLFKPKGFCSIPVNIKIGKTTWKTSIFPDKDNTYLLPIKKEIRQKENLSINIPYKFTITTLI